MRPSPHLALLTSVLALSACHSAPTFDRDRDVGFADVAGGDGRDRIAYDAPVFTPIDPIRLDPGGTVQVDLKRVFSDPDTPFEHLSIAATRSAHIAATVDGDQLTLVAEAEWSGSERIALRAVDPTGLSAEGSIEVVVEEPEPDEPAPPRNCTTTLVYDTFHGAASSVNFASELNGWSMSADPLEGPDGTGIFRLDLEIPAGDYGYKFVLNGSDWVLDPENPYRIEVDGIENSLLHVPDCHRPLLSVAETSADVGTGTVRWVLDIYDSNDLAGIDLDSLELTVNRQPVPAVAVTASPSRVIVEIDGLEPNRHTLRGSVADADGVVSEALFAPVWLEASPFDWRDAFVYFAFIDRFRNGDSANDVPRADVADIVNWSGGDFAGLTQAIEAGYFDDLGVSALWISSPNDNPDGVVLGEDGRPRTAYHSYFPSAPRATENHFGTLEELRALTDAAHRYGIRVLVDFVANHVYQTHPYYTGRTDDGDFNAYELCRAINWERPLTCWFEDYLPDLNYERRALVERTVEDALWWIDAADLDGFRIDAVKHMPHNVGFLLRAAVDRLFADSALHFYTVGETFVGLWSEDSANQLADYISVGELSGQFNFPLYWEIIRTIARRESGYEGFASLDAVVQASEARFTLPAIMGNFLGNHDVPRFVSHANGDIADMWGNGSKEQAFTAPPAQPAGTEAYRRLQLALTLLMTLPGVPVVYYGDEIGVAGAGDPDNRRMMPGDGSLQAVQSDVQQRLQTLGHLRAARTELRRGTRSTLRADDVYAFVRSVGAEVSVVLLNNADSSRDVDVAVSTWIPDGTLLTDALTGQTATVTAGRLTVALPGLEARIFTTAD